MSSVTVCCDLYLVVFIAHSAPLLHRLLWSLIFLPSLHLLLLAPSLSPSLSSFSP